MSIRTLYLEAGGGYDQVVMGTSEERLPLQGEITVRLRASSLNFHDYAVVSGLAGPTQRRIPLSDGAGEVIAVGAGVTDFKVGDAVVSTFFPYWDAGEPHEAGFARTPGDGIDGYARDQVTAPTSAFTLAPKGWTHAEAATLTTAGLTAWRALMCDARIKPGQTVLVQGTGGVSVFALQFAKMAGAVVIATSSSDEKLEKLRALGADFLINYRQTPAWGERVLQLTQGRGVDHVVEVGGAQTLAQSLVAARVGGHISLIGVLSGTSSELAIRSVLAKQLRLQGLLVGSRQQQQELVRAVDADAAFRPIIDRHFPLEELVGAFQYQESNRHFGKICIDI